MQLIHLARRVKNKLMGVRPARPIALRCDRVYVGSDYGGWDVYPHALGADSVVYAAGVGEDTSFDEALIGRFGCTVHAFDPTPRAIDYVARRRAEGGLDERFILHEWAISTEDGTATFHLPTNEAHVSASLVDADTYAGEPLEVQCRTLETIMRELGHARIDLLKLDIEGSEYEVLDHLAEKMAGEGGIQVGQVLFEVHEALFKDGHDRTKRTLDNLASRGLRVFAASKLAREYSLAHEAVVGG